MGHWVCMVQVLNLCLILENYLTDLILQRLRLLLLGLLYMGHWVCMVQVLLFCKILEVCKVLPFCIPPACMALLVCMVLVWYKILVCMSLVLCMPLYMIQWWWDNNDMLWYILGTHVDMAATCHIHLA